MGHVLKILYTIEPAQTDDLDEPVHYRCGNCEAEVDDYEVAEHATNVHNTIFFETEWDDIEVEFDPDEELDDDLYNV